MENRYVAIASALLTRSYKMMSPSPSSYFILALELILRRQDVANQQKDISLVENLVHLLGYADDVVVLDLGSREGIQRLESRVNGISLGSENDF